MAKITFGEGLMLEAKLPELPEAKEPQKEVIVPSKEVVEVIVQEPVHVDLSPLQSDIEMIKCDVVTLDQRTHSVSKVVQKLSDQVLAHIDHKVVDERQPVAVENTHIEEALKSFSDRLVKKDLHIKEVNAKLNAKINKQKNINIVLGIGLVMSILLNLI